MPSPVSDQLRDAVWERRLELHTSVDFYGELLSTQVKEGKKIRKWKAIIDKLGSFIIGLVMVSYPLLPGDFPVPLVVFVELLGVSGVAIAIISRIATKNSSIELVLTGVYQEIARLRNDGDILWLQVDDESASDESIRANYDKLSARLIEIDNRLPTLKNEHSDLLDTCHNRIVERIPTI